MRLIDQGQIGKCGDKIAGSFGAVGCDILVAKLDTGLDHKADHPGKGVGDAMAGKLLRVNVHGGPGRGGRGHVRCSTTSKAPPGTGTSVPIT